MDTGQITAELSLHRKLKLELRAWYPGSFKKQREESLYRKYTQTWEPDCYRYESQIHHLIAVYP